MADTGVVEELLKRVEKVDDGLDSLDFASSIGVDHQVIVGAVKSLQALGDVSFRGWDSAKVRLSVSTRRETDATTFRALNRRKRELGRAGLSLAM